MHNASLQISDISRLRAVDFIEYGSIHLYRERERYASVTSINSITCLALLHLTANIKYHKITHSHSINIPSEVAESPIN